ncbi:hypothetical protein PUN28_006512 [Cardiocondyla obscurior]|uniref:Uncharacterized protein n=1 Tax=Cardiocondyla obscurior TaxID=286306 RepID=A0AAW2GB16_9HYME
METARIQRIKTSVRKSHTNIRIALRARWIAVFVITSGYEHMFAISVVHLFVWHRYRNITTHEPNNVFYERVTNLVVNIECLGLSRASRERSDLAKIAPLVRND